MRLLRSHSGSLEVCKRENAGQKSRGGFRFGEDGGKEAAAGRFDDCHAVRRTPCAAPPCLSPTFGRLPCCQSRPDAPPDDVPEFFAQKTGGGREQRFNGACR